MRELAVLGMANALMAINSRNAGKPEVATILIGERFLHFQVNRDNTVRDSLARNALDIVRL